MASFIPWYGKKRTRLAQVEEQFRQTLARETDRARLAEAAEAVRTAQVRALKEKRQQFAPSEKNAIVLSQIEESIRSWRERSADSIIEGYRDPKRQRKMSATVRKAIKVGDFGVAK